MNLMTNDRDNSVFGRLEFWALTVAFVVCLSLFFRGDHAHVILYTVIFCVVMVIDFRVVPALIRKEFVFRNVLVLIVCFGAIGITSFIASTYNGADFDLTLVFMIILIIAGHVVVKQVALYIISKSDLLRSFFVITNRDGLMAFGLWMIVTYWLWIVAIPLEVQLAWTTVIPMGILLHALAFYNFLPSSLHVNYGFILYFLKVGVFCLVAGFGCSIALMFATKDEDIAFTIGAFSGVTNMIFTGPALLLIYRWQVKGREEIRTLQHQLGRSTANLDLLRSQVNPHFLFNALNTIYGLAIREKAERTSEAVEKLGDMMKFMLLENLQERISLRRELEYLDNYISLQRLRIDDSVSLTITVNIPEETDARVMISPMLLIPFVENAFKHGISHRERSYIKIYLELKGSQLFFDVSNSTHAKYENDPERKSNGIGLENVRQRLQHSYAGKHELIVRETDHDFFVHLRIDLQ